MDFYFRQEVEGWERIPEPPALLVGIHSGAPFVWDAWTVGIQWWRHYGQERPLHGTAHDVLMAAPGIGKLLPQDGRAPRRAGQHVRGAGGRDVTSRCGPAARSTRCGPWSKRDEAVLAGRSGFIKLAIASGVPIVPIATVGGPDSMPVLFSGRRLAKALQLDKIARLKVFPFAISAPWGIAPAALPEIPLPTKIRTAFQEPVKVANDPAKAKDDDYVDRKYEEVRTEHPARHGRAGSATALPAVRMSTAETTGTMADLVLEGGERFGDGAAFRHKEGEEWVETSYSDLADRARSVAKGLMALGLEKGDAVSIFADTRPEWVEADLGAACAGLVVATIYHTGSAEEAQHVLDNSESKLCFCENEELLDKVKEVRGDLSGPRAHRAVRGLRRRRADARRAGREGGGDRGLRPRRARGGHQRRRPVHAGLHVGHHGRAQGLHAHPRELPGGPRRARREHRHRRGRRVLRLPAALARAHAADRAGRARTRARRSLSGSATRTSCSRTSRKPSPPTSPRCRGSSRRSTTRPPPRPRAASRARSSTRPSRSGARCASWSARGRAPAPCSRPSTSWPTSRSSPPSATCSAAAWSWPSPAQRRWRRRCSSSSTPAACWCWRATG